MANQHIPKKAHISWKTKDILNNQAPMILNGLRNLIDLNPDWHVEISDDQDVDNYLKRNLSTTDFQLIVNKKIVEKTDLWRMIKIFNEGGMYIDLDRYYNVPMAEILDENTKCVLPTYFDMDFSQDIMISGPQNPIFREAIDLNVQRRRQGLNDIYTLGPVSYMHAITKVLIGRPVDRDPGLEAFNYREVIATMPFIKTYREQPPNDTVVFKMDEATFKKGNGKSKAEFYQECGVVHWTGLPPT